MQGEIVGLAVDDDGWVSAPSARHPVPIVIYGLMPQLHKTRVRLITRAGMS